jgi:hypothetical protein
MPRHKHPFLPGEMALAGQAHWLPGNIQHYSTWLVELAIVFLGGRDEVSALRLLELFRGGGINDPHLLDLGDTGFTEVDTPKPEIYDGFPYYPMLGF